MTTVQGSPIPPAADTGLVEDPATLATSSSDVRASGARIRESVETVIEGKPDVIRLALE